MTLLEFNNYSKENVTNEMFESLVLDYLKNKYRTLLCDIDEFGNKKYTLQDNFMGDTYYLIINPSNTKVIDNYASDKYMIAKKDEATLFLLVNHICGELPRKIPENSRCLLPFVNQLGDNPIAFFRYKCTDFAKKINDLVDEKIRNHKQYIEKLYEKCVKETAKQLVQEGYLLSEKDWSKKNRRIKLTGKNGENRICECQVNFGIGCVFFTTIEPFYPMHYYITDENDIPKLANQIVQIIKERRTF